MFFYSEELTKLRQVAKQMDFDNVQIKTKVSDMERIVNDLTADLNDSLVKVTLCFCRLKSNLLKSYDTQLNYRKSSCETSVFWEHVVTKKKEIFSMFAVWRWSV